MCKQKNNAKIVTIKQNLRKSRRSDLTINNQQLKLPQNVILNK